jgi:hypothetical protein
MSNNRKDLSEVLATTESFLDVKIMLMSMQTTMEFESKVDGRFSIRVCST